MTAGRSAGVLIHRGAADAPEVLLVLPGGPFWHGKNRGAWQIPKGGIEEGEDPVTTARREVAEELGVALAGALAPLGQVRQAGGKLVHGFACRQDVDADAITSNTFELEWPRGSGRVRRFPEVARARWFSLPDARAHMLTSQLPFLDRLAGLTGPERPSTSPA